MLLANTRPKLGLAGKVVAIEWVTGLDGPTGLALANGKLYAADVDRIAEIDIAKGEIIEQPTFGRLGATRFRSTNRRRNGFHRVAPAALEDAVLESSHAGVYTLQIHAFATRRAARTFGRQQLR